MPPPDLVATFLGPLNRTNVPYIVTGSVASTLYGEPRLTQDIDLVLRPTPEFAARLTAAFPATEYYVPPPEVLAEEAGRSTGGHFNLLHHETGLRADCYPAGAKPLNEWGLANRRRYLVADHEIWLAPIEYVILAKLEFFKTGGGDKHLADIAQMLRVSGESIDREQLGTWIERLGIGQEWTAAVGRFNGLRKRA